MTNAKLGKLVRLDPRKVWDDEARQFTPWLAENIALLNEALGLDIELVEREMAVGDFAVDLFGKEVGSGREVIIENQLATTDHNHLGQLLTYAAGLEAKIIIWISPQFRDEHKQGLDWLNRHTTEALSFFGVELELFQIGDSLPAPNFTVVAQPSEWREQVAASTKLEHSERMIAYHDFFLDLLNRLKKRSPSFTSSRRVGYSSWLAFGAGRSGFGFNPAFASGGRFQVELYIDTFNKEMNKLAFDQLQTEKAQIEKSLGEPLIWQRLDDKRACRISVQREGRIDSPPETLGSLKDWAVDELIKFRHVFTSKIKNLDLSSAPQEVPSTDDDRDISQSESLAKEVQP
ncbi:MAG: DUF4268 domain-containing protein [Chloroflexi bacterium]|nr:DUF4268 domain-containing protein [Chloroflexota bacterium]